MKLKYVITAVIVTLFVVGIDVAYEYKDVLIAKFYSTISEDVKSSTSSIIDMAIDEASKSTDISEEDQALIKSIFEN